MIRVSVQSVREATRTASSTFLILGSLCESSFHTLTSLKLITSRRFGTNLTDSLVQLNVQDDIAVRDDVTLSQRVLICVVGDCLWW